MIVVDTNVIAYYDCEFIALAEFLNLKLYTTDKKILNTFPDISVSLKDI